MQKVKKCSCGSQNIQAIGAIEALKYSPGKFFNLILCKKCGLTSTDIGEDCKAVKAYYPVDYKPHNPQNEHSSRIRQQMMRMIRSAIFKNKNYNFNYLLTYMQRVASIFYNMTAYRSIPFFRGEGRLLDIGCGIGKYLLLVREVGWKVEGIEPSAKAAAAAQHNGLSVKCMDFEVAEYPEYEFDVVTMWHVLEHFPNPHKVLQKVSMVMKDKGLLMIGIPNYDSFDRSLFWKFWNGFEIPLHISHFTPGTIRKILFSAGFQCIKIIHTVRPADMASSLENCLKFINVSGNKYVRAILYLISVPFSIIFSVLHRSSIIVVFAEKNYSDYSDLK